MENRKSGARRYENEPGMKHRTTAQKTGKTGFGKDENRRKKSIKTFGGRTGKESEKIRLNRFIANSGLCSRRDADEHIKNGHVTVNGHAVTDLGTKVSYSDDVRFRNKRLSAERKVYIL